MAAYRKTQARSGFEENSEDITRLLDIHTQLGGKGPGLRVGLEVLNKSAIVLITAFWEAYCEDVCAEGLKKISSEINDPQYLPKTIRKTIAKKIAQQTQEKDELSCWRLAGDGWQTFLLDNFDEIKFKQLGRWNTPSANKVKTLFSTVLGIDDITADWRWQSMTCDRARKKLDRFVDVRHKISHRVKLAKNSVKLGEVKAYLGHITSLVECVDRQVNTHLEAFIKKSKRRRRRKLKRIPQK